MSQAACHWRAGKCSSDSECMRPGANVRAQHECAMASRSCSSSAYSLVGSSKWSKECSVGGGEDGMENGFLTHSFKAAFIFCLDCESVQVKGRGFNTKGLGLSLSFLAQIFSST